MCGVQMQEQLLREEEKRKMLEEKIQRLEKTVLWAGAELHESPRASSTKDGECATQEMEKVCLIDDAALFVLC